MTTLPKVWVWDWPIRVFHWSLVVLLGFSWWSAETYHMDWHRWSGLTVLGLIVFRILWGLFGTSTARFSEFMRGPRAVFAYLRADGAARPQATGHNPLGGWSVLLLLLLLTVQVVSGLFAVDVDGIESGPLSYLVDFDQGRLASAVHGVSFTLLQIAVGVHVLAVLFYLLVKRRNLITAMISGYGHGGEGARRVPVARLALAVLAAATLAYAVAYGFGDPFGG
ncbi:MAG: cytochrome b/b6 domain-containing protein [Sphingomonas sp.]